MSTRLGCRTYDSMGCSVSSKQGHVRWFLQVDFKMTCACLSFFDPKSLSRIPNVNIK